VVTTVKAWMASAPEDVRRRFEFFGGRWVEKPVSGWDHNDYASDLKAEWKRRGLRANTDVITHLPTGEELHPDVLVIGRDNPNPPGPGPYVGVPDLVAEVLAADNPGAYDLEKRDSYARAGVRHYWLVRLKTSTVEPFVLDERGEYVAGPAFPARPVEAIVLPDDLR
jgi:Uma2 family endonuclease